MKKTLLKNIIQRAIDIHVHIGPEIIPRKYDVSSLIEEENSSLGGAVLKNHFSPTTQFISEAKPKKLKFFGSVVLNNFVGGLNPEAIYAASLLSDKPIVVWFPTISATNFLNNSEYEIAPEWVLSKQFKGRKAKDIVGITVIKDGKLTKEAIAVLDMIKQTNAVLATGHISTEESKILVTKAINMGIKKIVITHPIYQRINMPLVMQKKLAKLGCFIEQSYSMYAIDKIPLSEIVNQIQTVDYESVILSSDVGQPFSPSPSEALLQFSELLCDNGIRLEALETMLVTNPRRLLGIE